MADPALTLASTDFELFGVPARFSQDRATLDGRWKDLQREAHPDRFASQGATAQRIAMQWSVRINEAYQRLKDPLRRAAYLCELGGAAVQAEDNTAMPAAFLMQQMEWREALDEADGAAELDRLMAEVQQNRQQALARCEELIDHQHDLAQAVAQVRALMFIERFCADIESRFDRLSANSSAPGSLPVDRQ